MFETRNHHRVCRKARHPLPHVAFARFDSRNEITVILCGDQDGKARWWHRSKREDAEAFEQRVVRDLHEAAHTGSHAEVLMG